MGISTSKRTITTLPVDSVFNHPSALPSWPPGGGFASGEIDLGGLTIAEVTTFNKVWTAKEGGPNDGGATFFEPTGLPEGFSPLGYYAQPNNRALFGSVLVGKDTSDPSSPTLAQPIDYTLVWTSKPSSVKQNSSGYIWAPTPPNGFNAVGYVVTTTSAKPSLDKVRCVRSDLTAIVDPGELIWNDNEFDIYESRPKSRGKQESAVCVGTFMARSNKGTISDIACLTNAKNNAFYMPNLDQIHTLIQTYSPMIYLHPEEEFLPSSVDWFFSNGALLYKKGDESNPVPVNPTGSNLPQGGSNDGMYWLDLPQDTKARERVKKGDSTGSACTYFHIKPMFGGTYSDLVIWQFYPFNGGARVKVGLADVSLGKIGEHVGDWEHVTLRVSNFNGMLKKAYFSQHSGGVWENAPDLEYFQDTNKFVGYASLNGHANYPHPGCALQGSGTSVGLRNDTCKSDKVWDTGKEYIIVSGDYLGSGVIVEPPWLNYTREWGPKIKYDGKASKILPGKLARSLPNELSGEEGPTGPIMKDNWYQDEK